ncbi:MAG: hypothetical protein ACRD10_02210 [Terriglobia bacterium]
MIAYYAIKRQIAAEKQAREDQSKRERYGIAAVLRSEISSIWEVDLRSFSSIMRKIPRHTGTRLLPSSASLPMVPSRYCPVFERCAEKAGLLNRETVSLVVQFYKRVGELTLAWDQYNRRSDSDIESFDRLYKMARLGKWLYRAA